MQNAGPPSADDGPCEAMSASDQIIDDVVNAEYEHGFVTDIESESAPPGLNEDIIRLNSQKKGEPEFMLLWRLKA
jgi:Fe-S cluster assembly protein SufB